MKILPIIYFVFLFLPGIYFGIAGLTVAQFHADTHELNNLRDSLSKIKLDTTHFYNGVVVENVYDVQLVNLNQKLDDNFEYLHNLSNKESLILLSVSWGMIGGLIRLLLNMVYDGKNRRKNSFYIIPLLSALTGIVTYCITFFAPVLLHHGEANSQPDYFMYTSLVGGIFTKTIYDKLQKYIETEAH